MYIYTHTHTHTHIYIYRHRGTSLIRTPPPVGPLNPEHRPPNSAHENANSEYKNEQCWRERATPFDVEQERGGEFTHLRVGTVAQGAAGCAQVPVAELVLGPVEVVNEQTERPKHRRDPTLEPGKSLARAVVTKNTVPRLLEGAAAPEQVLLEARCIRRKPEF